jgi:hypothetical protein
MHRHVAIIGAGPIGIEAALYGRALGLNVTLFEKGSIAAHVADWGHVHLFTPWKMNTTPLGVETLKKHGRWAHFHPDVCPSGAELREHYLVPLTEVEPLKTCLRTQTTVLRIGRDDHHKADSGKPDRARSHFRLLTEDANGVQRIDHANVVIDCSGVYGHHRWAGRGGIPAPGELGLEDRIFYTLPDPMERDRPAFVDKHSLLLGCGHSASTFLKDIEQLNRANPDTRVTWAVRRPGQALQAIHGDPLPARRQLIESSLRLSQDPPEWLKYLGSVAVESLAAEQGLFVVQLSRVDQDGAAQTVRCDQVVALVGYSADITIYDQLQVQVAPESAIKSPEPDFYVLGAKSYGTNSNFLMQTGHQQVRDVFKLIAGTDTPDLFGLNH